jgi:NAD(P)-dependent dehydrogenase (short-subunit alcohol dehydrogenase family)
MRLMLRPRRAPLLSRKEEPALAIDSSWVILVTGGARGITAEVAHELALRYRPTLVIVGRSAEPVAEEEAWSVGLDEAELRRAIIERMHTPGEAVHHLDQVEAAYVRIVRSREIRRNLNALRAAGTRVIYEQVDVRDVAAVTDLVDRCYRLLGRIDGVIHGAGVVEDRLIENKSVESFERVLNTKALAAVALVRRLRPESLRFLVLFSSVAARFGNRGQADYAAANEILNKLALLLDREWAGRVVSINWGPWDGAGMVTTLIRDAFVERGIAPITVTAGRRAFERELRLGRKGEVEVILGAGPWQDMAVESRVQPKLQVPLLYSDSLSLDADGQGATATYEPHPARDIWLRDHQLDGKPVLPAMMAVELMAELAELAWQSWQVVRIRDLRVLSGVVMEHHLRPGKLRVRARIADGSADERNAPSLVITISQAQTSERACYRAQVEMAEGLPDPPRYERRVPVVPSPITAADAYQRWLFHGPGFKCVTEIESLSQQGVFAKLGPTGWPAHLVNQAWLIDPIVLDSAPQLAIVWARATRDMTALPSSFETYERFGPLSAEGTRCELRVVPTGQHDTLRADAFFVTAENRLSGVLRGLEATCTRALNRLADVRETTLTAVQ